jgi:hypothetical protein
MQPSNPPLAEDDIDEILYLVRTAEQADLSSLLTSLSTTHNCKPGDILTVAKDLETGNTVLHFAAANNSTGGHLPFPFVPFHLFLISRNYASKLLISNCALQRCCKHFSPTSPHPHPQSSHRQRTRPPPPLPPRMARTARTHQYLPASSPTPITQVTHRCTTPRRRVR